ncbi:hypothetical protein [Actinoplanes sp. L3-i22]|uniref:hypothetical protein n=1 Tax=Actinoplanes sp. L3-i22 TaxID=2836373 RepID=UPI001C7833AC|nr:hypothetical protein [Actinoplanes sp. L3-i22]BCY06003.1 hypothetical protein L3i22_010910 [Actinoplanes sp. L3-i22]
MNMLAEMLLHEPAPVAIWAALWLATVPAMVVLASPAGVRNPGRALLDACTFLIGRPTHRRVVTETAPIDFFRSDAASAEYASGAAFRYPTSAAEPPPERDGLTCANPPAGPVRPGSAVSAGPETAVDAVSAESAALDSGPADSAPTNHSAAPIRPAVPSAAAGVDSAAADRAADRRSRLGRFLYRAANRRAERLRREAEAVRVVRYAEEVRIAAESAGYAADRWQEHWESAAERVNAAFHAWQAADTRVRRSRQAAAFGTPATDHSPAEYADRERFLHLAVRAAAERGELPTSAVADALTARGGWNARLHPVAQELVIQRAAAAHLEAVWNRAVEAEARAWRDAQTSRRNWQSLCQEAILAEAHATVVQYLIPPEPVTAPPATQVTVLARVA